MTSNLNLTIPRSDQVFSSLPLESLIRMAASSDSAIEGLQAMAIEVGGRDGGKIAAVAERLRRGGSTADETAFGPSAVPILQAAANENASKSDTLPSSRLPRWVMLEDRRTQVRTSLRRIVWAGLIYSLIASGVGFGLQKVGISFLDTFGLAGYEFSLLDKVIDVSEIILFGYVGLIVLTVLLMLSWACRAGFGFRLGERSSRLNTLSCTNESFWNAVPFVGSTYRSIDLAKMSEAIFQSVSVGWEFSLAMRAAADQSRSPTLRNWLLRSADRLDRGESFGSVFDTCPLGAHWLHAMSQVLSTQKTDREMADQWRSVSDKLHVLMLNRGQRATAALLPATALFSVSILLIGWASLMGIVFSLMSGFM